MVQHPLLTATVPVGMQETTASTEVCIAAHTTMQHGGSWSMEHACMYVHMFHIVQKVFVSWYIHVYAVGYRSSGERRQEEKNQQLSPKPLPTE